MNLIVKYLKASAISILIIFTISILIAKLFSYHEDINYSNIEKIQYSRFLGDYRVIEYTDDEEIKMILQKMQHLNFYPVGISSLQESPTASINIMYSNNCEKKFSIAGAKVLITEIKNNEKIERDRHIYYVNPLKINAIFR